MTDKDKWIYTNPKSKTMYLRFRVKGFNKQFHLSTGLKESKQNIAKVQSLIAVIENDIFLGQFDPTLNRYKFKNVNQQPDIETPKDITVKELWDRFTDFQSSHLETTTIKGSYIPITRYIKKFPTQSLNDAALIRDWLLKNTTISMVDLILTKMNQCCNWGITSKIINVNPFQDLKIARSKVRVVDEDYRAFSLEQRDIIIHAFEHHKRLSLHAPLIKFLFWCGCRPGEAFALRWSDISADCRYISITKSRNLYGISKGTKNGRKRVFPCSEGSKLQVLLLNLRANETNDDALIFTTKTGKEMTSSTLNTIWNKLQVGRKEKIQQWSGVVRELVEQGKIPYYLKPYATRHTFATWAIASGSSPDKVAYWIGDSVKTVLRYYVHPEVSKTDCPDF